MIVTFTEHKHKKCKYLNKNGNITIWSFVLFIPKELIEILLSIISSISFIYICGIIVNNVIIIIIAIFYNKKYNNNDNNNGDGNELNQETTKKYEIKAFYLRTISFLIMSILVVIEELLDYGGTMTHESKHEGDFMTVYFELIFVAGPAIILSIIILLAIMKKKYIIIILSFFFINIYFLF